MHENRETSGVPRPERERDRSAKVQSHKADTHALEESDRTILSMNQTNKEERSSAEPGEKRVRAKENIVQPNTNPTQSGERVSQGLSGVREAAKKRRQERFTALLHHVNVDLLRDGYYALKRQAAPGVDGVTWQEYETGLENRLTDLHSRVHRGAYRAQPSRRVYIPKADGRQRPLGIAALEDKIVQQAVVTILNQIYEVHWLLPLPCDPGEHRPVECLRATLATVVVAHLTAPQSTPSGVGSAPTDLHAVASSPTRSASLSCRAFSRHTSKVGPVAP
jgi:RNA-directed DNA polymerase